MMFTPLMILVILGAVAAVGGLVWAISRRPELPPPPPPASDLLEPPPTAERPGDGDAPPPAQPPTAPAPRPAAPQPAEPAPRPAAPAPRPAEAPAEGLFARLKAGLSRTQRQLAEKLEDVFRGRKEIDEELFEELEMALISADLGVRTAGSLLEELRASSARGELADPAALKARLKTSIKEILGRHEAGLAEADNGPLVIMVVGVNGAGKTTTIGKLATRYARAGRKVILAAGDTFRAAAIEQLEVWGERAGVPVVRKEEGSDPSSVIYDALERATAEGFDVVIADTAGRLHTKINLMDELKKIHRVIGKVVPGAPHECLLVLDATTGQNAVLQARTFNDGVPLTGLVLTKLDGTAKGGIVVQVMGELEVPVKLIGIGEKVDDLRDFNADQFVEALL